MKRVAMSRRRWASATVEMAVVAPLLLTLVFGIIEYGWVFTVRQALANAAREGARVAVLEGSTTSDIQTRASAYLQPYGLTGYTFTITRATTTNSTETVQITIPYSRVTLLGAFFGSTNFNLNATSSMRKEKST